MTMIRLVKIGGNVVDDPDVLQKFVKDFAAMPGMKILVHGGGVMASRLQESMGMTPVMIEGRRVTDEETLKIVTMVYAGWCSRKITAMLQAEGCNAIGLSGADCNVVRASRRPPVQVAGLGKEVDYGYVGDVNENSVNAQFIYRLLENGVVPVFNAINHDGEGNLLNTNADTIASSIAVALARYGSPAHLTELIYCFDKEGVLMNREDRSSIIGRMDRKRFETLRSEGIIADGMIPKLQNSFKAIDSGVSKVTIKHARNLLNDTGTELI